MPSQNLSSPSFSTIESLVNLEVLKAVKAATTATKYPPPDSDSIQTQLIQLESRLSSKIEELKSDMNNLFTRNCQQVTKTSSSVSVSSQTEVISSSSKASTANFVPTPLFPFPPPPIRSLKTCSSQTDHSTSIRTSSGSVDT